MSAADASSTRETRSESGQSHRRGDARPVVDPLAVELFEARQSESLVGHPSGDDDGSRLNLADLGNLGQEVLAVPKELLHLPDEQEPRSEHPSLLIAALGEFGAAEATREAEIVPDQGAGARLATDRGALDHQGAEAL